MPNLTASVTVVLHQVDDVKLRLIKSCLRRRFLIIKYVSVQISLFIFFVIIDLHSAVKLSCNDIPVDLNLFRCRQVYIQHKLLFTYEKYYTARIPEICDEINKKRVML